MYWLDYSHMLFSITAPAYFAGNHCTGNHCRKEFLSWLLFTPLITYSIPFNTKNTTHRYIYLWVLFYYLYIYYIIYINKYQLVFSMLFEYASSCFSVVSSYQISLSVCGEQQIALWIDLFWLSMGHYGLEFD